MQPKQCQYCQKQFAPKYRVTKTYWSKRRFCSEPCTRSGMAGEKRERTPLTKEQRIKRFWAKVNKNAPNDCWVWVGAKDAYGYGFFSSQRSSRRWVKSHRFSYEIHKGTIGGGLCVCHSCDNPPCVNPAHLFLGTRADNNRDKVSKGRQSSNIGESNPRARLTQKKIVQIKDMVKSGKTQTEIARVHGVSQAHISRIVLGQAWLK